MIPRTISDVLHNSMGNDRHRLILSCVYEDCSKEGIFRVATDTHRIAIVKLPQSWSGEPMGRVLYPEWAATSLDRGRYPNWRTVLPEPTRTITIPIDPLIEALESIGRIARKNSNRVLLTFQGSTLYVGASSSQTGSHGAVSIVLPEKMFDDLRIAINYQYLLDCLPRKRTESFKTISFGVIDKNRPVEITYDHDGDWSLLRYVVMPMADHGNPEQIEPLFAFVSAPDASMAGAA